MIRLKWGCSASLGALLCMTVAGCGGGEKLVTVTGKVVQDGQPISIENYMEGYECLDVTFIPIDDQGNQKEDASSYSQDAQEDGSFEIRGDMGDGIPVGRYRVTVARLSDTGEGSPEDIWKGKFGPENSPFVFDINGSHDVLIDLAKAEGAEPAEDGDDGEDE
jgi:hypothetical protein